MSKPLAERMRPQSLADYVGQGHLVEEGKPIHNYIESGKLPSLLFWGPPGVGKTTLAKILAGQINKTFFQLSAVDAGVKEVRKAIETANKLPDGAILFIDEIHRFNKAQQDSLLGAVEKGIITLIGATTENPSFQVVSALLSICQLYTLKPLSVEDQQKLLNHAIAKDVELSKRHIELKDASLLMSYAGGDARRLLNYLELMVQAQKDDPVRIDRETTKESLTELVALYDRDGEQHYDTVSAFIKSIRGSDPQAALYYLARMIHGGEDPVFIARRLLILASEDIGNANPTALVMANTCFQAVQAIGYPECRIILSQTTVYLASSPKSNASYLAIDEALALVKSTAAAPIPLHLRNAPTQTMKDLDYGKGYKYAHDYDGHFVPQEFFPEGLAGTVFYKPADNPREQKMRAYLTSCWKDKYDI